MTIDEFTASLTAPAPPAGAGPVLLALWHDARGDWAAAHAVAQAGEGRRDHDRLHAYLHRKEGDASNAAYWYRRAAAPAFAGPLRAEWDQLVAAHVS